jgi:hypothetical protein
VRMASCAIWAFAMMMMIGSTVMAFTASYTTTTTTTKPSNSKLKQFENSSHRLYRVEQVQ